LALVVLALVGKILAILFGIPLVIGIFIGYFIGKSAGRISAHREFEQYANLSAQRGQPVLPPAPRRALRPGPRRAA